MTAADTDTPGTITYSTPQETSDQSPVTTSAPNAQVPGHPSFRRQRASRACETCHSRKVRCDAASLGVPCTNCVAFSIECRIPAPKRKRATSTKTKEEPDDGVSREPNTPIDARPVRQNSKPSIPYNSPDGLPSAQQVEATASHQNAGNITYQQFMKPKFARAPIKEAGRVAYLGESSNLTLLVHDTHGTTDVVHYPLPETIRGARARLTQPDQVEIDILQQRGAFLLPPRDLCDELVNSFFEWVAPVVPVINRNRFMKRYRDSKNPPSLLLLQAVLLAGSRVCTNPQLMDASGSTTPAAMTFYKRAKALYDANYEDDRITIVQALILMGWYWEGPEDVTKNVFYWTRVAIVVAQGSGMHRSVEASQLSRIDKRLWKRVWWTLFTRDRSVAVALGRPVSINTDDTDVEMLTEEDFIEEDGDTNPEFPPDPVHMQFFLQYVKLCEIMGLVLSQQYSVASKTRRTNAIDLTHSDMALADWLQNCPREVFWERSRHHFWSALLHSNYYTTLCLLHRAHMPPAASAQHHDQLDISYPSRNIAFQAAGMVTSIIENLLQHSQIRYTPAFIVYSLFSALIMHVYQMRSSVPSVVSASQERISVCMSALKEVSKVWLVAKMVHTLFESILGNKILEERLQKATGRKAPRIPKNRGTMNIQSSVAPNPTVEMASHHDPHLNGLHSLAQAAMQPSSLPPPTTVSNKRKFDDIDLAFNVGTPAPQVSYERSRPQTPALTPSRELSGGAQQPQATTSTQTPHFASPPPNRSSAAPQITFANDQFLPTTRSTGPSRIHSRAGTRANSPFNGLGYGYSAPGTPPDLFLVTRNSPPISQQLWENFQPDQLFPDGSIDPNVMHFDSPVMQHNVDPALQGMMSHQQQSNVQTTSSMGNENHNSMLGNPPREWPAGLTGMIGAPMDMNFPDSDRYSTSSSSGNAPVVPTTLNVEDWFQFFGMQSDQNGLAALGTEV